MYRFTGRALDWVLDHGLQIDKNGLLLIPATKWRCLQYTDVSIDVSMRDRHTKTLCIPSDQGITLLFEHKHFEIV